MVQSLKTIHYQNTKISQSDLTELLYLIGCGLGYFASVFLKHCSVVLYSVGKSQNGGVGETERTWDECKARFGTQGIAGDRSTCAHMG